MSDSLNKWAMILEDHMKTIGLEEEVLQELKTSCACFLILFFFEKNKALVLLWVVYLLVYWFVDDLYINNNTQWSNDSSPTRRTLPRRQHQQRTARSMAKRAKTQLCCCRWMRVCSPRTLVCPSLLFAQR